MFNMLNGLSVEISWDNYKPFNLDKWPFLPFVHFLLINFLTFDYCARLQAGLPFVVYPIFSAIDLLGIYQALKHVHLQTLTKVSRHWLLMSDYLMYVCKLSPTTLIITLIHGYTRTIYLSLGNFSLINTWPLLWLLLTLLPFCMFRIGLKSFLTNGLSPDMCLHLLKLVKMKALISFGAKVCFNVSCNCLFSVLWAI